MYWPCGVPQIFTHHGQRDREVNGDGRGSDSEQVNDSTLPADASPQPIVDLCTTRSDHFFATISAFTLDIWSTRPTAVLASLKRSQKSLQTYGDNVAVLFKPDSSIVVIRTSQSYLITYSIETDQSARVLQQQYGHSQARRQSAIRHFGVDETAGLGEILLRFRRAIKIDAGINTVLALEHELIVATVKPAAVQCIKWEPHKDGSQAVAQLLSKMDWISKCTISFMTHDRAMNLSVWIGSDGSAHAVQRTKPQLVRAPSSDDSLPSSKSSTTPATRLFDGYCFHTAEHGGATVATINARFSIIAVATANAKILCYTAKDYSGNIPISHTFQSAASSSTTGAVTCLIWSPDGYCLFAGYEHGWSTWSVFGKEGASSFHCNLTHAETHYEQWLLSIKNASWTSNGAEILLTSTGAELWKLEMSRSAAIGCFSCANLVRALLQTPTELTVYRGHELPDLTSISNEASLWHHTQYPAVYLHNQWPIRSCVVSQDGRYIAIAGRRGIAHYSIQSGRWKTFSDVAVESSFAVRGGMCWFSHVLAVATENANGYDVRLYSRELDLGRHPLHAESFSTPIVFIGPSGEDSLLVYTYENILYHYVINIADRRPQLVQVGQIAFHGVVRAPSRVRSVSWVVPDSQLRNGDPSRDVEFASVLFLVDDKLVLLQPSHTPEDELRYDMRVIAQHVEYYILMRDQIYFNFAGGADESVPATPSPGALLGRKRSQTYYSLRDSLWIFGGDDLRLWPDVREVLHRAAEGDIATGAPLLSMPVDFYPLSILLTKGVVLGIESELLQRRDVGFAQWRSSIRTQLFIPYVLRHQLCSANDTAAAFGLANQYQHLSYFPHALEILLHHVLDDEVDRRGRKTAQGSASVAKSGPEPLPAVLSFLQMVLSPTTYLSTIVQCIRKTELSFWQTLFDHLPPPLTLFEQALELEDLKTASGYLIVLQGLEDEDEEEEEDDSDGNSNDENDRNEKSKSSENRIRRFDAQQFEGHVIRLMKLAKEKADFELCSELARFVMGIDPRGEALKRIIAAVGFREEDEGKGNGEKKTSTKITSTTSLREPEPRGLLRASASASGLGMSIPNNRPKSRKEVAGEGDESTSSSPGPARGSSSKIITATTTTTTSFKSNSSKRTQIGGGGGDYFSASPGGY